MSKATDDKPTKASGDLVLQEVWRAKDALSAGYEHDLEKLFADTQAREILSGHPLVDPPPKRRKPNRS